MDKLEDRSDSLITFDLATTAEREATVTIAGELDLGGISPLDTQVGAAIDRGLDRLIVDVSGLRFADSSAIALWVRWSTAVHTFELRDPPALLRRVIGAMGLAEKLGVAA